MNYNKKANNLFLLIVIWNALLILFLVEFGNLFNKEPTPIRVLTATPGGKYYELGGIFSDLSSRAKKPKIIISRQETDGALDNFDRLTTHWPNTFALGYTKVLTDEELSKSNERKNIRCVQILYKEVVQVICRKAAKVTKIKDLVERDTLKVYIGKPNSGTRFTVKKLFEACGLSNKEKDAIVLKYSKYSDRGYSKAAEAIIAGKLDVVIFDAGLPTEAALHIFEDIPNKGQFTLLNLDTGFIKEIARISKKMYQPFDGSEISVSQIPNRYWDNSFNSVSTDVMLATHKSYEPEIVFDILRFINDEYFYEINKIVPGLENIRSESYRKSINSRLGGILEHAGTDRFLSNFWTRLYTFKKEYMPYVYIAIMMILFALQLYVVLDIATDKLKAESPGDASVLKPGLWKVIVAPIISGIFAILAKLLD